MSLFNVPLPSHEASASAKETLYQGVGDINVPHINVGRALPIYLAIWNKIFRS